MAGPGGRRRAGEVAGAGEERALREATAALAAAEVAAGGLEVGRGAGRQPCPICFEPLSQSTLVTVVPLGSPSSATPATVMCQVCFCSYHLSCLLCWLQTRGNGRSRKRETTCPHCRTKIGRLLCVPSFSPVSSRNETPHGSSTGGAGEDVATSPSVESRWARASEISRLHSLSPSTAASRSDQSAQRSTKPDVHVVDVEALWSPAHAPSRRGAGRHPAAAISPEGSQSSPRVSSLVQQALELRDDRAITGALKLLGLLMTSLALGLFLVLHY